jgi:sialic acid synthase SpsE
MEPQEFRDMVDMIRLTEKALGHATFEVSGREAKSRAFRRSLFVAADVKAGEVFTETNLRCVRPANGLHPRHLTELLGRKAAADLAMGTPLAWEHVAAE